MISETKETILFIQLPLLSHTHDYVMGNIDYARAAIEGYILRRVSRLWRIYRLPFELSQFGSNRAIVRHIEQVRPSIVAFTCFLWNIERSLSIACEIKQRMPRTIIVMGGVEIQMNSIALSIKREQVDYFVIGEGEWFFERYLSDPSDISWHDVNGNRVVIQPPEQLLPREQIVEPFTEGCLDPMPDGSVFFELSRGCYFSCAYCLYSKNYRGVREMPYNLLSLAVTELAHRKAVSEIYIVSPALNCGGTFKATLEKLAQSEHGVRLHSEMRAEGVDESLARLLYRAGFRSMEVGIQTLSIEVLKRIGRHSDPYQELKGMEHLKQAGIELTIGVIPGLPGEERDTFVRTVERLVSLGFADEIALYPLMILPGTAIRDMAIRDNIAFSPKPPYYYHGGWGMSFDDICEITSMTEHLTGISHAALRLPDFTEDQGGTLCKGVRVNGDIEGEWDMRRYERIRDTAVFTLHATVTNPASAARGLKRFLATIDVNDLYIIVIYSNELIDETQMREMMYAHERDSLLRRIYAFHEWRAGCSVRIYQIYDEWSRYRQAANQYWWIVPVMRITKENSNCLDAISPDKDRILVGAGMAEERYNALSRFSDALDAIAFEDERDERFWYEKRGVPFVRIPSTFRVERQEI